MQVGRGDFKLSVRMSILNATGELDGYIDILEKEIDKTLVKVSGYFELGSIDITVAPFQKGKASPSGIGGVALSAHRLELLIDSERDDVNAIIEDNLLDVLAHEIHHCLRMALNVPSETLAQHLVMEGLACHFEHTITGGKASLLFENLQNYDWREGLAKMKPLLNQTDFSFEKLFLGSMPAEFPKYAGYWIGFNLVATYMQHHKASDSDVVGMAAEIFFEGLLDH